MQALPVPAAQYFRMSTDHQQYSLDNQAEAIFRYASQHGFQVVKTYSDGAKSGLRLKNRPGLKELLKDALDGNIAFRAILVYDVSRWGRFQDIDESAHYEYLCKSAGAPIHYCAEMFGNENNPLDLMMKALKRTMAGEFSRELSVKVRAGLSRLAKLGYKLGGSAPYGLRRQLLDVQGRPKQILGYGDRKSLANERVTFGPGPEQEAAIVRRIFREFADEHRSVNAIAERLNEDGVPYLRGATWKGNTLRLLLQDPRYLGIHVWGRTTALLSTPVKRLPASDWIVYGNAFTPIVPQALFLRAQEVFANFTIRLNDKQLLDRLRIVHAAHGHLTGAIIEKSQLCPGLSTYNKRFGGLLNVYTRLGLSTPELRTQITVRQRVLLLRSSLINEILEALPNQIERVRENRRFRGLLRYRKTGLLISVVLARCCPTKQGLSWLVEPPRSERKRATIIALLDERNVGIESLRIFPNVPRKDQHMRLRPGTAWLASGFLLENIGDLIQALGAVRSSLKTDKRP